MTYRRLELLREKINTIIGLDKYDYDYLLALSRELDVLILKDLEKSKYCKEVLGDKYMKEFDDIFDKLQLFEKMYQSLRIVDPIGKRVLEVNDNGGFQEKEFACYDFWENDSICENCISMRAYNENDTIFKMEIKKSEVYMVTAIPVTIKDKKLIVEMLKNANKSLYLHNGSEEEYGLNVLNSIEHMNHAAVTDELTKLRNRRFINERLPADLLHSALNNEPMSIVFADLDFFKSVNDTYGHITGDQVIRETGDMLKSHIRGDKDWIARYGGEEFLICLPNTDYLAAKTVAERMRKSISEKEFKSGDKVFHMTCSFGVHTVCNGNECMTIDNIIDLADKKLYEAKNTGRNKVM